MKIGQAMTRNFMKAKATAITGAILAATFPLMSLFGVDLNLDEQAKIVAGVTALVGVIASLFGESPAQKTIDKNRRN